MPKEKIKTTDAEKSKVLGKALQQSHFIDKAMAAGRMGKAFGDLMVSIVNRFSDLEYRILKLEKKIKNVYN